MIVHVTDSDEYNDEDSDEHNEEDLPYYHAPRAPGPTIIYAAVYKTNINTNFPTE